MGSRDYGLYFGNDAMTVSSTDVASVSADSFRHAMAQFIGSVHIVTTTGQQGDGGITVTAVSSVSDSPPTLLVCLNRKCRAHDLVLDSGVLAINTLAAEHRELADIFAGRGDVPMAERFGAGSWKRLRTGSPILETSVVSLDCRVASSHNVGTHRVFFCTVLDIASAPTASALLYGNRKFATHAC
jgi:flavin reductase